MIIEKINKLVRPFIVVCFMALTITLAIMGKIDAEAILQITGIIVAFYFAERAALKKPGD